MEVSVERVQRFVRRRQGHESAGAGLGRGGAGGGKNRKPNVIRCLKLWIPRAHARWKRRRREGGVIIYDFLKDARLSQNNKAIYLFRRNVLRWVDELGVCKVYIYMKGA